MTFRSLARRAAVIAAAALTIAGCVDLTVPNLNNPDRLRATSTPGDVENLIASTFLQWYNRIQGTTPTIAFGAMGYEFMSPFLCFSGQEVSLEPRPSWNNTTIYSRSGTSSAPWLDFYGIISLTNDGLQALDRGIEIGPGGVNNDRARAFGKFMQGVAHGYLGLLWDKAAIIDESTNIDTLVTPTYVPYDEVNEAAIEMLEESLAISNTSDFTLPSTGWIQGLPLSNEQLAQLTHTFIARFMAYNARTEQERADVNWQSVLDHINSGITADFAPIATPEVGGSSYLQIATRIRAIRGDYMRPSNWLVGPADSSDRWKAWVATPVLSRVPFEVISKDRRIEGPAARNTTLGTTDSSYVRTTGSFVTDGFVAGQTITASGFTPTANNGSSVVTGVTATELKVNKSPKLVTSTAAAARNIRSPGKYVDYEPTTFGNASRGTHLRSFYYFYRYGAGTTYNNGPIITISLEEMNLLKAEALIRLNRAAEAIPLINATRVSQGQLPPVDINGPPDAPGCVPRKTTGACGSLWDALRYEKRIEVMGTDGQVAFFDSRGWKTLSEFSFLNFPIPGRELEIARLPGYTHGGAGGTMAAPAPNWDGCPPGITLPRC
jgi:hypothetical protein